MMKCQSWKKALRFEKTFRMFPSHAFLHTSFLYFHHILFINGRSMLLLDPIIALASCENSKFKKLLTILLDFMDPSGVRC